MPFAVLVCHSKLPVGANWEVPLELVCCATVDLSPGLSNRSRKLNVCVSEREIMLHLAGPKNPVKTCMRLKVAEHN